MKRILFVAALAVALPAEAQIYKCQEGDKTIYSQMPCGPAPQTLDIKRSSPRPGSFEETQARRDDYIRSKPGLSELVAIAIRAGVAIPGMTEEQVLVSMGEPADRNLTQTAHMSRWQWVYRYPSGRQHYVYLERGVVVATN